MTPLERMSSNKGPRFDRFHIGFPQSNYYILKKKEFGYSENSDGVSTPFGTSNGSRDVMAFPKQLLDNTHIATYRSC